MMNRTEQDDPQHLENGAPDQLAFPISTVQLEWIQSASERDVPITIDARDSASPVAGALYRVHIAAEDLLAENAEISPISGAEGSFRISKLPAAFLMSKIEDADLSRMDLEVNANASFRQSLELGLLPERLRPEWLDYSAELQAFMREATQYGKDWECIDREDLVELQADLKEELPGSELVPLLEHSEVGFILCVTDAGEFVIIDESGDTGLRLVEDFRDFAEMKEELNKERVKKLTEGLEDMKSDSRYLEGIEWGEARSGHPEGAIKFHLKELESNLAVIADELDAETLIKLQILIHTHDSFKGESEKGVGINHPESHASLARKFVESHIGETELSPMLQFHDKLYSLYKSKNKPFMEEQFDQLVSAIPDWSVFLSFVMIDNLTNGKNPNAVQWAVEKVAADDRIDLSFDPQERFKRILNSDSKD